MKDGQHYKIKKMDRSDINEFCNKFQSAFRSGDWKTKHIVASGHMHQTFKLRSKIKRDKEEVENQSAKISSSFYNFNAFLKNLESLDDVFSYIRSGLDKDKDFSSNQKQSEADQILEELGCVEVITKSEAGRIFYRKVAQQINDIFKKVLPRKGGVMSLIDVYLYYNRMRGSDLVTTDDLLKAARELKSINSVLEMRELPDGLKVIQLRTYFFSFLIFF